MMQPKQPKITQKLQIRSAIGLLILAGLILVYRWWKSHETDPYGSQTMSTVGWIAAIETVGEGKHAVVIKPDGTVVRQPNPPADSTDQDPAWRPDGNFLFFSSDRDKDKFTMFRWRPDGGSSPEMRSMPGPGQGAPFFLRSDKAKGVDATLLIVSGGTVKELDPKKPSLRQVVPPPDPKTAEETDAEGSGRMSPFETMYRSFGTSFRNAKWTPDRKAVYAVMRGDVGEVLIYQKLDFTTPQEGQPQAIGIASGDRVDFDIDQNTGIVYFTVENFHWLDPALVPDQFKKDGKLTTPWQHGIGMVDPQHGAEILIKSDRDQDCFGSIALSPNGERLLVVHGKYAGSGNLTPDSLVMLGVGGAMKGQAGKVADGEIYEPTWAPDNTHLAFAKRESATSRPIYIMEEGNPTPIQRSPSGIFGNPKFSPQ